MRSSLVTFVILLFVSGGQVAAQTPLRAALGKPAVLDGRIEPAEWSDATQVDMTNGGKLFLKSAGGHVYIAIRGGRPGWSHLYLSQGPGSDISVIHASAALGRSVYKRDANNMWQPANEFVWEVRGRDLTPEMRSAMDAYLTKNQWVASNNTMGTAGEFEYKLALLSERPVRFAAVFVSESAEPQFYPTSLIDDTLKKELLAGNTPGGLKFDTTKWAALELSSSRSSAGWAGTWEGAVTRGDKRWRVNANLTDSSASVDFIDLNILEIPFPLFVNGNAVRLERPQPSGNPIVFDGTVKDDEFSGTWKGLGVDGVFLFKRGKTKAKLYTEEEVSFANGDVNLSGTLLLPDGKKLSPAVVIVHGSSPNERTTYRSWARDFANNGIAALVYDKRGSGRSTGNTRAASMENLADDALAAIRMLKVRRDIDAGKVGIAGHSQGGWIAPLAAARSGDVAFVIVSAAAAVTPAEQSIFHRAGVMRNAGITDAEIAEATRLREKLYLLNRKILANDADVLEMRSAISKELSENKTARWFGPAELPPELNGELPPRGALELLFFDVSSVWPKVKVPVLAVWGSRDTVVPVEKSRVLIEELLNKAGNKDLTIKVFEGVDHGKGVSAASDAWDFPRASAAYDLAMVDWLKKKLG